MLKGDIRKKQILETSELLFSERGYEATGIQDILNLLHLSKGSFYHHFESKEQVLKIICENRAQQSANKLEKQSYHDGLDKMSSLLHAMIPFQGEGFLFFQMILPVFILPEGKSIRSAYQEALKKCWLPLITDALQQMISEKQAFVEYPQQTCEIALDLVNDLWDHIGQEVIMAEESAQGTISPVHILKLAEPYRLALENLFSAPYGSLEIVNLEDGMKIITEIHSWWISRMSNQSTDKK